MKKTLMKKIKFFCFAFFYGLLLTGCAFYSCAKPVYLVNETWPCQISSDTRPWIEGVDAWFLTGRPSISFYHKNGLIAENMFKNHLPRFSTIQTNGGYQIQLVGGQKENTITIMGLPETETKRLTVKVCCDTLFIQQNNPPKNSKHLVYPMNNVVLRIGVSNLHALYQLGNGTIYGRKIFSDGLQIFSSGSGNLMLFGSMNVYRITQMGGGNITVFGAITPVIDLIVSSGIVNVGGDVGIHSITNNGGYINIIGANSDGLCISTSGSSCTKVIGNFNLQNVIAKGCSHVYLCGVRSCATAITASNNAEVGVSGITGGLCINLKGYSRFFGKNLHSQEVYVSTKDSSHANLSTNRSMFARVDGYSSVYYFGGIPTITPFVAENATLFQAE